MQQKIAALKSSHNLPERANTSQPRQKIKAKQQEENKDEMR
jgi:hypothetical protein